MRFRLALVYLIGVSALAFGFYEFWRSRTVDQSAFLIGTTCIVSAAAIHAGLSLWEEFKERRAKRG